MLFRKFPQPNVGIFQPVNLDESNSNVNSVHISVNSAKKSKSSNQFKHKWVKRKRRTYSKQNKNKLKTQPLTFFSCNSANIKNKLLSLEKVVNDLSLSMFCLQESHARKSGSIKFKNSTNFQIYEKIRSEKGGGGLVIGMLNCLNPTWIRDGGDEVEAMTIKFSLEKIDIRVVNAYGPQEYDDSQKRQVFGNIWMMNFIIVTEKGQGY